MTKRRFQLLAMALFITVAVLAILLGSSEFYFRRTGRYANYCEKFGMKTENCSSAERLNEPWLWVYRPNSRWTIHKPPEFSQEYASNSEGLLGPWPSSRKRKGELRIVAVGDSFTVGVGDPENLGYVGRLALSVKKNQKTSRDYLFVNAGVAGSDPIFEVELIRRKLLKLKPDLILLTMNGSDVDELRRRGGLERFGEDGILRYRPVPSWAWLFHRSHLVRAIVLSWLGFGWDFVPVKENHQATQRAIEGLVQAGIAANGLAVENGFKMLILMQPLWNEIRARTLRWELAKVSEGLRQGGVEVVDLVPGFLAEIPDPISPEYYWPRDTHFTPKGYQAFSRVVEAELRKRGWVSP